jgi:hypothetical protein
MAVHGDPQRPEAPDAVIPQAFWMKIVGIDSGDPGDPGCLQCRDAAYHCDIGAAVSLERRRQGRPEPAAAVDQPRAVMAQQRSGKVLHAHVVIVEMQSRA